MPLPIKKPNLNTALELFVILLIPYLILLKFGASPWFLLPFVLGYVWGKIASPTQGAIFCTVSLLIACMLHTSSIPAGLFAILFFALMPIIFGLLLLFTAIGLFRLLIGGIHSVFTRPREVDYEEEILDDIPFDLNI